MRGEADGMAARNIRSYVPSSTHLPHVDALLTCDLIGLAGTGMSGCDQLWLKCGQKYGIIGRELPNLG